MNIINQIEDVDGEFKGDFHSEKTFKFVEQFLEKDKFLKDLRTNGTQMLEYYPKCSMNMSKDDIRYNFLDDSKKRVLASYGFPLGFRPKFGPKRPANELIPTQFDSNGSSQPCYMQFLIFYESLEE